MKLKSTLFAMIVLLMGIPMAAAAQAGEPAQATADEATSSTALREELKVARHELAEAARKLARIRRELADAELGAMHLEALEELERLEGIGEEMANMGETIERKVRRGLRMTRPRLGVLLGADDEPNLVVGVTPGSGAEAAGLVAGDRLVAINGQPVDAARPETLRAAMAGVDFGDVVTVEIERDDKRMAVDVTVSSPARSFQVITREIDSPPPAPGAPDAPRVDREVIVHKGAGVWPPEPPLPPRLAGLGGLGRHSDLISNHSGLKPYFGTAEGVIVLRIDAGNPLGLEDGDVVLSIDDETVFRPVDIGRAVLGRGGQMVTLEVMRAGKRLSYDARLPEPRSVSATTGQRHQKL